MNKPLYEFFTSDHRRIEDLLDKATENPDDIRMDYYHEFRTGLLKHIKMEEKILFPAAQKANNGKPIPLAARLRLDHGALTSLMVVPPNAGVIRVIRHILERHDVLEEEPGGMYDICEGLTEKETEYILIQLEAVTEVPVHPHNLAGYALEATKRAVERAGYDYDTIAND
ncbi:MAG TPA: hemerythrin domain-containing protein [Saprospiraceae bacterium]|mgnify:FL=1|nr:hemerythrin domain-containing protein [Candidatus Parvibacillus calidus]HQN57095.1 hemerythrin domain-containing protein [Saprospiraceae bacterium]